MMPSLYTPAAMRPDYSAAEDARLLDLAEAGVPIHDIAVELKRDRSDVLARFNALTEAMADGERRALIDRRKAAMAGSGRDWIAPQRETIDAKRREAARRRSVGAMLLGDPPPGYSALDRRAPQGRSGANRKISDADREALLVLYQREGQEAAAARALQLGVAPNYAKKLHSERGGRPLYVPTGSRRAG